MSTAEQIFEEFGQKYDVRLIPGSGGVFEVELAGELIYSKKATGRHSEYDSDIAPHLRG
ncbi:MAG: Rdx family protein [Acidimicrobiia bacterium]|nr:Rdx family protein [Acidimicrobiia bacterium]